MKTKVLSIVIYSLVAFGCLKMNLVNTQGIEGNLLNC